jgi:hypothetical protein
VNFFCLRQILAKTTENGRFAAASGQNPMGLPPWVTIILPGLRQEKSRAAKKNKQYAKNAPCA